MKHLYAAIIACLFLSLTFCACGEKKTGAQKTDALFSSGKLNVTATIFPPFDFVRAIAGGSDVRGLVVNLSMLLPPGAESHSFDPTPRDIIKIQNSDVFIYNGGESDVWVDRILESIDTSKIKIVRMMSAVNVVKEEIVEGMQEEGTKNSAAAYDEHIWTSPKNAKIIAAAITDKLCEADAAKFNGANTALFRRNAESYIVNLDKLDAEFKAVCDRTAAGGARRKTLVFGDRFPFRYFADIYGISYFAAFPGCSTESEPAAATVAFLIDKIKSEKIPAVFHIELSNEKMADTIAEETGAKKLLLHSGHNITKRELESGITFLELQRANVPRLKEALW